MATGADACAPAGRARMGLAEVAAGRIDGYVELHINLWDVAAALADPGGRRGGTSAASWHGAGPVSGAPILAAAPGVAAALTRAAAVPGL